MKRIALLVVVCTALPTTAAFSSEVQIGNHHFTLADGFEIELVAGPPLVDRPISADFDEQGRLYVSDSAGSNDKVAKQLEDKPHRIVWLEDSKGDGRFDKSKVFADKMMFPEGVLWFNGAVYCGAPPSIWKLEDTNGDGVADRRTEWFQGKTLTGCANDLHGPYLGPDGWIYWCKGAFAKQTYERPGQPTISDSAAHIFRCRPDGSGFDSVMSGGMDNPVEIAFTSAGDAIFTTTFYTNPQGGKRDALVHAVYGSVFPKVHGVLDGLKRTGELMPALTHLGPAAPSGLMCYCSKVFGTDYEGNLFSSQFNLHKIQRHVLEPAGATFNTRDIDFLVSDNPDFHPTDVLEDADGSLLVVDTGGWYKICCPTSQLAKPEVLGAIYRIRRKGATPVKDPRGLKLKWNVTAGDLVKMLDDSRFAVRNRAIAGLAKLDSKAIPALAALTPRSASVEARRNAVWALTRIDSPAAQKIVRSAFNDPDASVQQAAAHSAGLLRDSKAVDDLRRLLPKGSPTVAREAAAALGQIGDKRAVPALLEASHRFSDRAFEHAIIYAIIQIDDPAATRAALKMKDALTRRAALIALDQMDNGNVTAQAVVPLLKSTNSVLKETASWIAEHHTEWAGELRSFFKERIQEAASSADFAKELQPQLVKFVREQPIQELVTEELSAASANEVRVLLLNIIASSNLKKAPLSWSAQTATALHDSTEPVVKAGLGAARAIAITNRSDALNEALLSLARNAQRSDELRLEALALVPPGSALDQPLFDFAVAHLNGSNAPLQRVNAAGLLGRSTLSEEQLSHLTSELPNSGPLELAQLLPAFDAHPTEDLGLKLVNALKISKALSASAAETVRTRLSKFPSTVKTAGEELLATLNVSTAEKKKRLDEYEASLDTGDYRRGHLIFNGTKAACATCHAIGYGGGQLGPDLTRIGSIRTRRDLLEAVLYPSASFVRGFEPMTVRTKDGEEHSGLVQRETSDSLVLVSGPTAEQRIARADIAEMRPGTVSVMPEGLDQQLTRQEMADLIAFLRALK